MSTYTIERTRTITEVFRVEAATEEAAISRLDECTTVDCDDDVEQMELSTHTSVVKVTGTE